MPQAWIEKLAISRSRRDVFGLRVHVRVTAAQHKALVKISDRTGRSMADLVRAGVDLLLTAGDMTEPVDLDAELAKRHRARQSLGKAKQAHREG